jgi:hypothetical protein
LPSFIVDRFDHYTIPLHATRLLQDPTRHLLTDKLVSTYDPQAYEPTTFSP